MDSMQSSIPHTLTMQNPTQVPVPRPGQPTAGFIHRSNAYSPAIHAWLLQDESEVPWHNLASIVVSSTSQDISQPDLTGLPSDNPATQGSVKCDNTVAGMATAHIQDKRSFNAQTRSESKPAPAYNQQKEPSNTKQGPRGD